MNNEALSAVLDSYLEFIDIMEKTLERASLPQKYKDFAMALISLRRESWKPVRDKLKECENGGVQM